MFPRPSDIRFSCSCLDHASMCKHVAAILYGVGARLDHKPELLFRLRAVDESDLLARVDISLPLSKKVPTAAKVLGAEDVSTLFGLDMAESPEAERLPEGFGRSHARGTGPKPVRAAAAAPRTASPRLAVAAKQAATKARKAPGKTVVAKQAATVAYSAPSRSHASAKALTKTVLRQREAAGKQEHPKSGMKVKATAAQHRAG